VENDDSSIEVENATMSLTEAPMIASLPAHDIDRAKRWYEEKLGLTPVQDLGPAGQLYSTGGTPFIIFQTPNAGTGKHTLGGWVVPDIDATMTELKAKGVAFLDLAMGDQGPSTENGVARDPTGGGAAWFTDSEENVLVLTELPPGMALPGTAT
jgi:catechol 2,3-dioxygenase-like lactoylglutathione lyase family enzyme